MTVPKPQDLLLALSLWKVLCTIYVVMEYAEPGDISTCISVVYGNVMMAYAAIYHIPSMRKWMDSHTEEANEISERIRQRSEEVLPYDPEAEFRDRVRLKYFYQEALGYKNYLSYISDLGNDLASKMTT